MKKLFLLMAFAIFSTSMYAQVDKDPEYGSIKISVMQDLKFATIGDSDRGYEAFTKDIILRMKWEGFSLLKFSPQDIIMVEYENADLEYGFERATVGYGRSINIGSTDILTEARWKAIPYLQIGGLARDHKVKGTFVFGLEHEVIFSDHFAIIGNHQFMYRSDFGLVYGTPNKVKYSFHMGVQYRFDIFQPTKTAGNWRN